MTAGKTCIALLILAVALAAPAASPAQSVWFEAENYTDYYDFAFSPIQVLYVSGCSNGYILYGLDTIDEWVEYTFSVSSFGIYSFTMHCQADQNQPYTVQIRLTGGTSGQVQVFEVQFTGTGYS